jgi:hypothetical protein
MPPIVGQLPAVLPLNLAEQPLDVRYRMPMRRCSLKVLALPALAIRNPPLQKDREIRSL